MSTIRNVQTAVLHSHLPCTGTGTKVNEDVDAVAVVVAATAVIRIQQKKDTTCECNIEKF